MTIIEAHNKLKEYFDTNNSFIFPDDVKKISDGTNPSRAAIAATLALLEKDEYLKSYTEEEPGKKTTTYVLYMPESERSVEISVSRQTANNIANLVSSYIPLLDIAWDGEIDPQNLGEAEIIILLQVLQGLSLRITDLEKESASKSSKKKNNNTGE